MASKIAKVLEILNDGQWHMVDEIQKKANLDKTHTQEIVSFLKEYNFIIADEIKERIKLKENVRKFLAQTTTA